MLPRYSFSMPHWHALIYQVSHLQSERRIKYSHLVATPMARLISRAYIYRYFTCLSLYWWFHSFFVYLREVRLLIKSSNSSQVSRRNSSESHQTFNTCFIESHEVIMVFVYFMSSGKRTPT